MKKVKSLTDTEIKKVKHDKKQFKLSDGKGLYLVIKTNGTKMWRYDFSFGGKRKSMSFGIYPTVSLKEAREQREEAKKNISSNVNPINHKKIQKENQKFIFENVSNKWLDLVPNLGPETKTNYTKALEKNVYPIIGKLEIYNVKRKNIVDVLVSLQNKPHVASRVYNLLKRIFSYSCINYDLDYNPVDFNLNDLIKKKKTSHHKTVINEIDIKPLKDDIRDFKISGYLHYSGVYALKFLPYVFVRISSLLKAKWQHIDFEKEVWLFPKENTKTNEDYLYPMPKQIIELLMDLNEEAKVKSDYLFITAHNNPKKHLNRGTPLRYLKKHLGYEEMTLHGFRSTFSTNANIRKSEHGFSDDIIEACLSHAEIRQVKKAYDRGYLEKYINEKRSLIQWYANWLDNL